MSSASFWAVDLGPGVRAGFTTREGGTSGAPFRSFNLGLGLGDDDDRVRAHRRHLGAFVGAPVRFARQVHGATVLRADGGDAPDVLGDGDALLSTDPGAAVAVLVADCVPVLLADPVAGAVAAVHVGRRGLVAGVLAAALDALVAAGADPGRVRAAVGPSIAGASYEVPAALRDEVADVVPGTAATTAWGTPALDLPAGVLALLAAAGVRGAVHLGADTFTDRRLFSFRRAAGSPTGRSAGVVRPPA